MRHMHPQPRKPCDNPGHTQPPVGQIAPTEGGLPSKQRAAPLRGASTAALPRWPGRECAGWNNKRVCKHELFLQTYHILTYAVYLSFPLLVTQVVLMDAPMLSTGKRAPLRDPG